MPSAPRWMSSKAVRFTAVVALLAAGLGFSTADASTPTKGTLTSTATKVTWSGGPFAAPNATGGALDQPDCTVPQSCDDFTLHVSTPAGLRQHAHPEHQGGVGQHPPPTSTSTSSTRPATVVGSAASSADPEQVVLPPNSGDYTVRVVPYAPLGQTYDATATLATIPAEPRPRHRHPAAVRRLRRRRARCPTRTTPASRRSAPATRPTRRCSSPTCPPTRSKFDDSVSPAKATWTDASASAANGCPQGSTVSLDPILFTDHKTGRTFESQLAGANSLTCYTDDDGATWNPEHRRRHPLRRRPPDHRRRRVLRQRHRRAAHLDVQGRRLLLQPGHRDRVLRGLP